MPDQRDVTNRFLGEPFLINNGLGNYWLTRNRAGNGREYAPHTPANEEICSLAIQDMQIRRAGGFYGSDDDGTWYPMHLDLAAKILWEPQSGGQQCLENMH